VKNAFTLVLFVAISSAANAQNLLKDSGFESPAVPAGSFSSYFVPGQKIGAWDIVSSTPTGPGVTLVNGSFQADGITFNAHTGKQYLNLNEGQYFEGSDGGGVCQCEQGVEQTVMTTTGANYILTFWLGSVYDPTTVAGYADMSMVDVYINGYRAASMVESGKPHSKRQIWNQYSVTFTASSNLTKITLLNGTQWFQNDAIDDVELLPAQ